MDDFKKEVIRHGGDRDHDKTFCIFAVRVNTDNTTGQRKMRAEEPYYLMQGFTVVGDMVRVDCSADTALQDRMLFGTELEPERFGERPMSKLKYDILEYLHVI